MPPVISVESLSKSYRLGQIGTGTFTYDLAVWWAKMRGKPNPMLRIGETDHGNRDGEELWALKDISFTIEQGEVLGIIGRNGAGKSTLLKILSRVTAPTSGRIRVRGRVASLLEVGTGFHPELTGRENIYLNGAILGMTKQEVTRKFDEIVDFAEVEKFIDTPVKRYSSGMYVRLAFAVAAHLDPEILVVDEVLAVGDIEFQKKCLGKMGDVSKTGKTILFVSHNMSAISNLCNRTILLEFGQVRFNGLTSNTIQEYQKLASNIGKIKIGDRQDRKGDMEIRITHFEWINPDKPSTTSLTSGNPITCIIHYEAEKDLSNVDFAIGFRTITNEPLFICASAHAKGSFNIAQGSGLVKCYIDSLPLSAGSYAINLAATRGNIMYDWITSACIINVDTLDYYGNGSNVSIGHSPILVKSDWQFEKQE